MRRCATPISCFASIVIGWMAAVLGAFISPAAAQESWPNRRVTMVVPFGAGSGTDALARWMAEHFKDILGQPFIVENRGGAGGTLGANVVAKAAPDGYTFLHGSNTTHSGAPSLIKNVPYDPVADFTPVARIGKFSSVVVANPLLPFRSMADFVAYAKANPGKLSFGHGNSAGYIVGMAINKRNGIDMARVPYTTVAQAMTDVLANNIQVVIADLLNGPVQIRAGKVVALATVLAERSALLPDVPTLSETVMPGFELQSWTALFGPRGLSPDVARRMANAVETIMRRPDATERLGNLGAEPWFARADALDAYVKADIPRWAAHAKEAGIQPE